RDFHVTGVQTCALPIYGRCREGQNVVASEQPIDHPLLERSRHGDHPEHGRLGGNGAKLLVGMSHGRVRATPKRRYRTGNRNKVRAVAEISPPTTTMASGRCISDPGPVAKSSGTSPKAAMLAVIITGRRRRLAPSTTVSSMPRPRSRS